jgi:hypothetical protein
VSLEGVPLLLLIELMKERCASLPDALSSWQPIVGALDAAPEKTAAR